jgi:ribose 5-phosphate isomerase RpiB
MSKLRLFLFLCFSCIISAEAQINYSFSPTSGTYTSLARTNTDITQVNIAVEAHDEGYANNIPLGFSFNYNGVVYTSINANTNGFASFKPFTSITDTQNFNYWLSDLHSGPYGESGAAANRPLLAPLWDDLDLYSVGDLQYITTGAAPNRIFTLQWSKVYWTVQATQLSIEFQVKLYESSNQIDFVYNQLGGALGGTPSASIGITAEGTGDGKFLSLNNTSSNPTASSTVNTFTINTKPATGQVYRFTPGATLDPTTLNYTFSAFQGSYQPIEGGVPAFVANAKPGATTQDEGIADSIALFMPFKYNGANVSFVSVHTNGFLSFQSLRPITDAATQNFSTPDLANGPFGPAVGPGGPNNGRPILAPLWDDNSVPTTTEDIRYQTSGTAPNRVFTIEWSRVRWNKSAAASNIEFQVRLYETSNVIEYQYNQLPGTVGSGAAAAIGLTGTGTGSGNFLSLNNASAAPTASSTASTNTINTRPATGQIYRFTPLAPPVVSNCTPVKATTDLSVTASAADNFFGAVNDTRQVLVTVRELGGIKADSAVIRIPKVQASGYTFRMGSGADNANWLRREDANFVYFDRIGGMPCGGTSTLAISMNRTNPSGQQFSVSFRVLASAAQSADFRYNDSFSVLFVSDSQ